MQGPFLVAIVFTLIIGVIGQHKEFFSSAIAIIFFGIFFLVSIVLLTKGYKEFKEYRRGKKQERASIRQLNPSTPQWRPTPQAAKDVAAHKQSIAQQDRERRKQEFSTWYPHEIYHIMQTINDAIAQGQIACNRIMISIPEIPKGIKDSIYWYYIDEIKKDLEKAYIPHGWKSVDVKIASADYVDDRRKLEITLFCD